MTEENFLKLLHWQENVSKLNYISELKADSELIQFKLSCKEEMIKDL